MKESAETYAQFTMAKIRAALHDTPLSDLQYREVYAVLLASTKENQHSFDFRLFIPVIFRNFYIVVFAGRDRRKGTLELDRLRWMRTKKRFIRSVFLVALLFVSLILGLLFLWLSYQIKSALGIDIFPGFHLTDLLPVDLEPFREK